MRPAIDVRRAALTLLVLAAACYPGWLVVGSFAEPPAKEKKESEPGTKRPFYFGASSCSNAGCHGSPPEKWPLPLLCQCNEYTAWADKDKHADAYNVLSRDRGKRMAKLLDYDVTKDARCLSCHAVVIKDTVGFRNGKEVVYKADEIKKNKSFTLTDGVSCTVCHGSFFEWEAQHKNENALEEWRPLDRKEKERLFGMTDLWDPAKRTKLCASCHIGNAEQGKVVTHDMYAAGHPPLPGFEVATFSNEMPRHWKYLGQKSEAVQKAQRFDGKTREQTQLLLVGAAVSLGESLRLIAAQAKESQQPGRDPELAMFDCYSCHHEIRSPSWRLTKPAVEKPGRVPMRTWPLEMVRLAVRYLAKDEAGAKGELSKLDEHTKALEKAFIAKQLGDAPSIVTEATSFAKWADKLASDLQATTVDEATTKKLLALLPATFATTTLDFDSARQVAWGYEVLSQDAGVSKAKPGSPTELETYLALRFPEGRMKAGEKSPLEAALGARLKTLNCYQPDKFRDLLKNLGSRK